MEIFDQATELHQAGKYEEAAHLYDMLLSQNPDNAGLCATIGTLYLQTKKWGHAVHFLECAVRKNLRQSDVLSNLALAYKNSGQYAKALQLSEEACKVDPSSEALTNYAGFFSNTGTPEKAIPLCEKAIKLNPENALAHWNLALALLESGQWGRGWDEHDWGLKKAQHLMQPMRTDRGIKDGLPVWDGTPGKTVAVYGEQGLGDEIMFASMLPDLLKTNKVIVECHKRLKTLFEHAFPQVTFYGTREDAEISWPYDHDDLEYRIAIGSLGKFYRRSTESFPGTPYLKAEPLLAAGRKLRVGISWTGGQKQGRIETRSVPLTWWGPILDNDCEFVSLQYTDCVSEISVAERANGWSIEQFPQIVDPQGDYMDTARLVASCDLVISACTSVVHLAGALGVPTWCMVPSKPAWRYGIAGPMRWYRAVRLYRQPKPEPGREPDFMPVVARVGADLADLVASRAQHRIAA